MAIEIKSKHATMKRHMLSGDVVVAQIVNADGNVLESASHVTEEDCVVDTIAFFEVRGELGMKHGHGAIFGESDE